MIQEAIYQAINKNDLTLKQARAAMQEIMEGQATNAQISAFLTALRMKGESIDEITACASVMREKSTKLTPPTDVLDIVGTGGDEACTFNISTVSAFVVSAAGVPVAKHGNRSVSSKCGSADLLEALGVKISLSAAQSAEILDKIGLCFMFAPTYHASMKYAAPVRKEIGVRTLFNILGPLANPAGANLQLLGVYASSLVEPMARVLANLGVKAAMVVHGHDGLDEATLCAPTTVCRVSSGGRLHSYTIEPEQLGLKSCSPQALTGGGPSENAAIARDILSGQRSAKRDVVVLNSALCLQLARPQLTPQMSARLAEDIIDSGAALTQLEKFIALSNSFEQAVI